jgi:hypothetical protein
MLTPEECAAWLKISRRALTAMNVPCFKLGHKTLRYHVRTVLAAHMQRAGVPVELIRSSLGGPQQRENRP